MECEASVAGARPPEKRMQELLPDLTYFKEQCEKEGLYRQNADPNNWNWVNESKNGWEVAPKKWRKLREKCAGRAGSLPDDVDDPLAWSLKHLPHGVAGDSVTSFLVREGYEAMFDHVWVQGLTTKGRRGCIITGQPGTGKRRFQLYLLVRLLQMGQPVLFSPAGDEFYLFFNGQVYYTTKHSLLYTNLPHREPSRDVFIWSVFNMYPPHCEEPPQPMVSLPCCPVQIASLNEKQYKIWNKQSMPLTIGMPLWTEDELRKALPYQKKYSCLLEDLRKASNHLVGPEIRAVRGVINEHIRTTTMWEQEEARSSDGVATNDLPSKEPATSISFSPEASLDIVLQAAINKFGYSAWNVFHGVQNFEHMTEMHEGGCSMTYDQLKNAIWRPTSDTRATDDIYDWVLALSPVYPGGGFTNVEWDVSFKSDWAAQNVLDNIAAVKVGELCEQYLFFEGNPRTRRLARYFFERLVHCVISGTSEDTPWPLIPMASDNNSDSPLFSLPNEASPDDRTTLPKVNRKLVKLPSILEFTEELENNTYYVPQGHQERNNRLFDAFIVNIGGSSADLWVIQTTTFPGHAGGSPEGYRHVRAIIKRLKAQLKEKGPRSKAAKRRGKQTATDVDVRVHYVLAVPAHKYGKHQWRFPMGWRNVIDLCGNVYCLKIPTHDTN